MPMMWNRMKRWLTRQQSSEESFGAGLQWIEPGADNPFGVRLLDCRPVTWNLVSTTRDQRTAEQFVALRHSDGRELVDTSVESAVRLGASLSLPHNGAALEGIAFKSDVMEVKWDIYIYDSVFLFTRSWTGELRYRAVADVGPTEICISEIECRREDRGLAPSDVYFVLATHAMGRVLPHQIPEELEDEDAMTIAQWSFARHGKLGCYATTADVTAIPLPTQRTNS